MGLRTSKRARALVLLTIQNATIGLITRASRLGDPKDLYLPSSAVLFAEFIKALISWRTLAQEYRKKASGKKEDQAEPSLWLAACYRPLQEAIGVRRNELVKLSVPALLYAGQNNLLYIALSNLSAAIYQVTYQLKILTTAVCSVLLFGRQYSYLKWFALCILTVGVAIVQLPTGEDASIVNKKDEGQNQLLGLASIFVACISSAFAGCYFEAILKPSKQSNKLPPASLAMQNFQLALVSIPFSLLGMCLSQYDRERILSKGLLHGYSALSVLVVLNQAIGGLLIARVVKEADSVSKGFATSFAVILSTIISSVMTHSLPNKQFLAGASFVVVATSLFASVD